MSLSVASHSLSHIWRASQQLRQETQIVAQTLHVLDLPQENWRVFFAALMSGFLSVMSRTRPGGRMNEWTQTLGQHSQSQTSSLRLNQSSHVRVSGVSILAARSGELRISLFSLFSQKSFPVGLCVLNLGMFYAVWQEVNAGVCFMLSLHVGVHTHGLHV